MTGNKKLNLLILLTAFSFLALACSASQSMKKKPDIYFVLFDALRADHLGAYGYGKPTSPGIDALAKDSVLFEDSYSASVSTSPSLPKLFTGTSNLQKHLQWLPSWQTAALAYPRGVTLLNSDLQRLGYHTIIVSAHQGIRGSDLDAGFDEQHYLPPAKGAYASAYEVSKVLKEVTAKEYDKPIFVYVHVMDTHFPHPRNEYFEQFSSNPDFESKIMKPDGNPYVESGIALSDQEKEHLNALYDCNIRQGDDLIRDLSAMLEDSGKYEDSLVLVTADHGDMMGEGKEDHYIGHAAMSWEQQTRVPLILKLPGDLLAGTRVGFPVGAIDVKPTLLTLAIGPEALKDMIVEGLPLIRDGQVIEKPERLLPLHWGFRYGKLKFLYYEPLHQGPYIFDLAADPQEQRNLLASGWPEKWPEGFSSLENGVRYGDLEIIRPVDDQGVISVFLASQDPEHKRDLMQSRGLELDSSGYGYPAQPFYVWPGNANTILVTPDTVLNLTNVNINTLDPHETSKTPEWADGKWSLSRNWMWHSPDEDPGETIFRVNMDNALDGQYGFSIILSPYSFEGGNASSLQVSLDGRNWVAASTMEAESRGYAQIDGKPVVPIGVLNVEKGTLQIRLKPERELRPEDLDERENQLKQADKRHWALIYAFKFTPLGGGTSTMSDKEQDERLKQLRELGYIQ